MAQNSVRPGWWRRGRLGLRFVVLGTVLGIVAAVVHLLSYALPTYNPVFVVYYLVYLVIEILFMSGLGIVVAGAVIVARLAVDEEATHKTRSLIAGAVALALSGGFAFAVSNFGNLGNPWAVAVITGSLVGGVFAKVTYRHPAEI